MRRNIVELNKTRFAGFLASLSIIKNHPKTATTGFGLVALVTALMFWPPSSGSAQAQSYPKPSIEWIGSHSQEDYFCEDNLLGTCVDWDIRSSYVETVYSPRVSHRGKVKTVTYYPDYWVKAYRFRTMTQIHIERRDGTSYVNVYTDEKRHYIPAGLFASAPRCKGKLTWTDKGSWGWSKVIEKNSPKLVVTSSPNQRGSVKWDIVFNYTKENGNRGTCSKSITLSPNQYWVVYPCKPWFSRVCYDNVLIHRH
ncbi:MAG: hypothetical protein M2R45_01096 [Verrucomicrobia subdivision 3 bacterium]|nr:hypothetical protein [Limisphaerales bacterium]MCS1414207.1 hypothetical protein [Limisphaerales bacterium]